MFGGGPETICRAKSFPLCFLFIIPRVSCSREGVFKAKLGEHYYESATVKFGKATIMPFSFVRVCLIVTFSSRYLKMYANLRSHTSLE